ncbi:hypothetical protein [methane-oxidizing endosymbiont of Gigantopelta aegis]|uniref:hypothetical protein n=1 Tax=methane-oxidizing endosymbiont of Gigantopelta aegis TaxID=2794938 RepID=UPI0018DD3F29|nr:hypothetical protein [methane-oxidizing endosymbiont of Gigantopelta aegis]
MNNTVNDLLEEIKALEKKLVDEIQKKQQDANYQINAEDITFKPATRQRHKKQLQSLFDYFSHASIGNILSAPIIWAVLFPTIMLDISVSLYQAICFPIYKIPKVKRHDYIVFDRHYLSYLNIIEKLNCAYCSYFNGLIAYVQEIAARTEQYWCPIKHARRISTLHSRYQHFLDYGDAEAYRAFKEQTRRRFNDVE